MFLQNILTKMGVVDKIVAAPLSHEDRRVLREVGAININHLRLLGETDPMGMRIALRAAGFDVPRGVKRVKARCLPITVRSKIGNGSNVQLVRPVGKDLGADFLEHFDVIHVGQPKTISNKGKVL